MPHAEHEDPAYGASPALATVIERLEALPLLQTRFDIHGHGLRVLTDDASIRTHFASRLAPFVASTIPDGDSAEAVVLTEPQHVRACGLSDAGEYERLDSEIVFNMEERNCLAAVLSHGPVVLLGATTTAIDRHWLVDYLAEIIPGLLLGGALVALHASAVATPSGAVAFAAEQGSGKSTMAAYLASVMGWPFIADDILLLCRGREGTVTAAPLYADLHFPPGTVELVPGLAGRVPTDRRGRDVSGVLVNADPEEQQEFRMGIQELWPEWRPASLPVRAVLFPTIVAGRMSSRVSLLSRDEAWLRLSAMVLPYLCDHWPSFVERDRSVLRGLLAQCPCWRLYVGRSLAGIERLVEEGMQGGDLGARSSYRLDSESAA